MTEAVSAAQIEAAIKILSTVNFAGMLAAFESQNTEAKIIDGLIAVDDAAEIAGIFIPPIAIVANDLKMAIEIEQIAVPFVEWLAQQPMTKALVAKIPKAATPGPRQILIGGHVFDIPAWEFEPGAVFQPNQG